MAGHVPDSLSVDWCTEDRICLLLEEFFQGPVDLDPCSNRWSRVKANEAWTLENGSDGLVGNWGKYNKIFVNPPFGKGWWKPYDTDPNRRLYIWPSDRAKLKAEMSAPDFQKLMKEFELVSIGDWIERCRCYGNLATVVGLFPCYPSTRAWQTHVWPHAQAVLFPKGRLRFRLVYQGPDGVTEKTGPAPMDCSLVLWTPERAHLDRFKDVFKKLGHVQPVRPCP